MNPRKPAAALANTVSRGVRGDRTGTTQAPARPSAIQQLDQVADGIEKFKIEFERFLAGATHVPPEDQRLRLVRDLRDLRTANLGTSAEQFRLASLEARFNSYSELFNRRLRDREEGRGPRPHPTLAPAPAEQRLDVLSGVVVSDRLEPEAIDALYQGLIRRTGGEGSAPVMELAAFRGYLSQQLESIRLKTGCEAVQFRVAAEDGKLKLKAKPVSR